ncbi:MAG: hypothetical protein JST48_12820 [Bacteroidetes bacterium]|nr:hypothetical protein [Bacteroidota bacterium]
MKKYLKIAMTLFIAWFAFVSSSAQPKDETAAIKEVIAKETQAFFGVNRKAWANCWLQVPYAYWSYSDSTATSFIQGWDGDKGIYQTFEAYFRTNQPSKAKISQEWLEIKVFGNGAYARYLQTIKDEIDRDETSEVRVLEKKDGQWKVIHVGAIAKYPNLPTLNH